MKKFIEIACEFIALTTYIFLFLIYATLHHIKKIILTMIIPKSAFVRVFREIRQDYANVLKGKRAL